LIPENFIIKEVNANHKDLDMLFSELDNELLNLYPVSSLHPVDISKVNEEDQIFLVAYATNKAAGCGGMKEYDKNTGELKRIYVRKEFRGKGIARGICEKLEKIASRREYKQIILETGTKQPESMALYRKLGYHEIPKFGEYVNDPFSVCFKKMI
jgi:GNAT superfamily N-acetyltransferase